MSAPATWESDLREHRHAKDRYLTEHPHPPLPPDQREDFGDSSTSRRTPPTGSKPRSNHEHTWILDFNRAYSPFCAYPGAYECPLVPMENWLGVRIEVGERARQSE